MNKEQVFSKSENSRKRKKRLPQEYYGVNDFVKWYKAEVAQKPDKEIDFVEIGYTAYDKFYTNLKLNMEIAHIIGHAITRFPDNRTYDWIDDDGEWDSTDYLGMARIRKKFLNREKEECFYGDYSLETLGTHGGGFREENPCANVYLSYAYLEKYFWDAVVKDMQEKILNLYQKKK